MTSRPNASRMASIWENPYAVDDDELTRLRTVAHPVGQILRHPGAAGLGVEPFAEGLQSGTIGREGLACG